MIIVFISSRIQEGIADYIPSLDQGLAVLTNSTVPLFFTILLTLSSALTPAANPAAVPDPKTKPCHRGWCGAPFCYPECGPNNTADSNAPALISRAAAAADLIMGGAARRFAVRSVCL